MKLTRRELEAVIAAAGDADAGATFECMTDDERERERWLDAYDTGLEKLREMLAQREQTRAARQRAKRSQR